MAVTAASTAVFLDKDGTVIEDVPYNIDPSKMRFAPGAEQGLRALRDAGYRLVIVSNQSGVARGYFSEPALAVVEHNLREMMAGIGIPLDGFYYCPHHPDASLLEYRTECGCRKPKPGLLLRAAQELDIDLSGSWLIGDILDDIEAGRAAGCGTVLIGNGNETEWRVSAARWPDHIATDLAQAARYIAGARREAACR